MAHAQRTVPPSKYSLTNAAVPATMGVAIDVPSMLAMAHDSTSDVFASALMTYMPGAMMSGLYRSS